MKLMAKLRRGAKCGSCGRDPPGDGEPLARRAFGIAKNVRACRSVAQSCAYVARGNCQLAALEAERLGRPTTNFASSFNSSTDRLESR